WGHINIDQIEFGDTPKRGTGGFQEQADFGTVGMVYFDKVQRSSVAWDGASLANWQDVTKDTPAARREHPLGLVEQEVELGPNAARTLTCALTWFFPNHPNGHVYANRFQSSIAVGDYLFDQRERLIGDTLAFHAAYYDSSLPHWLLDRLIAPVGNLATGTCQVWKNGRFWAWEGVGCCSGTCTHVWNYEHALARLFPALARSTREMQDLGEGFHDDGLVGFRSNDRFAADGQAGTVLKIYREHLMSADDAFLRRNWKKTKKALEYLIRRDANADGLIESSQHNTYDIEFHGPNTFVGSLYLAAVRAGEEMAKRVGDVDFARSCSKIFASGSRRTMELLFNGEYFEQKVDLEKHPRHQYADGCLADQLFGQGWARQVSLGDLYPRAAVLKTLRSIYKYNWAPDVGPQNARHAPERYFARKGEAGLFLCTWPKSKHLGRNGVRYRNEIWTGIEYQVAGHMLAEGLLEEGLAIIRGVHERYDGAKFNPFNEVECGDHYARALASWGCLLGISGFEYDGPAGRLGFRPRMTSNQFRAFFTAAQGWGSLSQTRVGRSQSNRIHLRWGRLRLRELHLQTDAALGRARVRVAHGETDLPVRATHLGAGDFELKFDKDVVIERGQVLHVSFEG
ncbi:MAG: GH116 family glycosyl hydrolase, partial [Planctomycetota bacterium]